MRSSKVYVLAALCAIICMQFVNSQVFDVLEYNAKGDGKTEDTKAIRAALAAAEANNGGEILFRYGFTFLTGCFNVTSNIILNVKGRILASLNPEDYVKVEPLPWYGGGQDAQMKGKLEWQAVVRSFYASNITLTGGGTIDGQGAPWWKCSRDDLKGKPCNGTSRPNLVMFVHTTDISVHDITLKDSPSWNLHLANCTNVHVNHVTITAPESSHNTDGYDIDCSSNVLVENSYYSGGDDAIAVKSGIDYLGRTYGRTTENVYFRNITIGTSHGASIGSEMSAGVRNVTFENITLTGSDNGIRIKSQRGRGGIVQDITYTNILLNNVKNAIYLTMNYSPNVAQTNATATPQFKNIIIKNVVSNEAKNGWFLDGLPESFIQNATFSNIEMIKTHKLVEMCANIHGNCVDGSVLPSCPPCLQ